MSNLYDPFFSKKDPKLETTAAVHTEEASGAFVTATIGGITGPKIPVLVNPKDRLCVPVKE